MLAPQRRISDLGKPEQPGLEPPRAMDVRTRYGVRAAATRADWAISGRLTVVPSNLTCSAPWERIIALVGNLALSLNAAVPAC
jgi:hypothetical protein